MLAGLFKLQAFWLALWGLLQTIVLSLIPGVPDDFMIALGALVAALIASDLIEGSIKGLRSRRVLIAAIGVLGAVLGLIGVPDHIWISIEGLALTLITYIAIDDRSDPNSQRRVEERRADPNVPF